MTARTAIRSVLGAFWVFVGSNEDRAGWARRLILVHDAETTRDLLIGFNQPAHIAALVAVIEENLGGWVTRNE